MKNDMQSTRGKDIASIDTAIRLGLARDGGLFIPEKFPQLSIQDFYEFDKVADFAAFLLAPFFTQSILKIDPKFCQDVFSFPLPVKQLSNKHYILELFHGPTLSFKDFGARFFAQCLEGLLKGRQTQVLVATSGDTGSAVACALHHRKGIEGIILFPKDNISTRQQAQITCWGYNIKALAVNGSFDQCQQLVKMAFSKETHPGSLTTANSINIARLLPQIVFYAYSSVQVFKHHQQEVNFIVPSGNLGNVTACYWAKALGFPIEQILIANNANRVLSDYLASGLYQARPCIKTLANAMDVGDPSNLERLIAFFRDFNTLQQQLDVRSVDDAQIRTAILDCYQKYNYILCPHTATAYHRLQEVHSDKPWVIASTAHPAKFNELIEPLLHIKIPIPEQLQNMLKRQHQFLPIEAEFKLLQAYLHHGGCYD